ncbi:EAL domain-containing protein [Paraglaciecola aquimarina]|uniref:EAL domain-containing protein n=1 Tax=Paraglaciecola algarum TaxID=3050085 RepID=A0ABS9D6J9_9ALTE|nr:EAL domain-containing protein [Paraglaciecola sp. G1-23]MCF2947454.1 EAL domain-containing protein [Paraglaciecola sp. G1-23]
MQVTEVTESFSLDSVVPFFQPIMDLNHNAVWSYECLARLMTVEERACLPSEFLYLVERQDLVAEFTQTIFNRSANYFRDINMAWNINVSLSDISDTTIHQFLLNALRSYPNPQRISVEITAQNALTEVNKFSAFSDICQQLGVKIVIDHFDQSTSDLKAILALPISAVKVSGNFLEQATKDVESANLAKDLINQCAENNIVVVAEHIEQKSTLDAVQSLGVQYAQGFYFSQPKASAE